MIIRTSGSGKNMVLTVSRTGKAVIEGADHLFETVLETNFRISSNSFFQVNAFQASALGAAVISVAAQFQPETVVDAYCGVGLFSILLAKKGLKVTGIDSEKKAIEDALFNAKAAGLDDMAWINAPVEEALKNIEGIIREADGIIVARGDLGICIPIYKVPVIQKEIIKKCRLKGKPVVVATQMMESMILENLPTRAEVSDVANALLDGATHLLLSGETAIGKHPHRVVDMMNKVIKNTEGYKKKLEELLI